MFARITQDVQAAIYAAAVKGIVAHYASHLKLLTTYGAIADSLGILTPKGGHLDQALAFIAEDDLSNGRVPSTAVVVSAHTGKPGSGFFQQLRQLGYNIPEGSEVLVWEKMLADLGVAPFTLEMLVQQDGTIVIPRKFVVGAHGIRTAPGQRLDEAIRENAREFNGPVHRLQTPTQVRSCKSHEEAKTGSASKLPGDE